MSEQRYIYGIVRSAQPLRVAASGVGGKEVVVQSLHHRELAAVVSTAPEGEIEGTRRQMMAHAAVLDELVGRFTTLPMRFGTVAPDEAAVQRVLHGRYDDLQAAIARLDGQIELGLKLFWRDDHALREVVDATPAIKQLRDALAGRPLEQSYYERIRLGRITEQAMNALRDSTAALVLDRLRPLARQTRVNPLVGERMVLNAAFLLDRNAEARFDEAIARLDDDVGTRVQFKYAGNVPPYNFVDLALSWS